jgi:hypothetical protein
MSFMRQLWFRKSYHGTPHTLLEGMFIGTAILETHMIILFKSCKICIHFVQAISTVQIQTKEKLGMCAEISLKGYLSQHCCHSKNIKVIQIPTIEDWFNTL